MAVSLEFCFSFYFIFVIRFYLSQIERFFFLFFFILLFIHWHDKYYLFDCWTSPMKEAKKKNVKKEKNMIRIVVIESWKGDYALRVPCQCIAFYIFQSSFFFPSFFLVLYYDGSHLDEYPLSVLFVFILYAFNNESTNFSFIKIKKKRKTETLSFDKIFSHSFVLLLLLLFTCSGPVFSLFSFI